MAKLYIFGIGGTGARVIKSLTFLLASGVKLHPGITTIVPILIDPDNGNGDLTRTTRLLDHYMQIHQKVDGKDGFFATPIKTLNQLTNGNVTVNNQFKMLDVSAAQNQKFRHFIGLGYLSQESKSLVELLFSSDNLNADMSVGFKGNPNIGSIVLNQFKNSPEYKIFLNSFSSGDSIFIISSIFGGTGAAGFPLLLRNLRSVDPAISGSQQVASAPIGALSMMPYFKVNAPVDASQKTIDSSTFMGKAKAALSHYSSSIFNTNEVDAFYSLGEDAENFYEHNDGQAAQKNNAHFLELAAATAIVDFTMNLQALPRGNNSLGTTLFREFGISSTNRRLNFKSMGNTTVNQILEPLSKMHLMSLFHKMVQAKKSDFLKSPWFLHLQKAYTSNGIHEKFLKEFEEHYLDWFREMKENDVSFDPFKEEPSYDQLLNFIDGYEIKGNTVKNLLSNKNHGKKFEEVLNTIYKKTFKTSNDPGKDLLILFNQATEKQINSIVN